MTENIANSEYVTNVVCSVGNVVKLYRPYGYPPVAWPADKNPDYYKNGFRIIDTELGKFIIGTGDSGSNSRCVYYKHERSGKQVIQYYSTALGTHVFYVIIEGILVHDHASIHQGGPAFASYYTEIPQSQEE